MPMAGIILLLSITALYAGYNLFIKVSSGHIPPTATTTVLATICLQVAALVVSLFFTGFLMLRGGYALKLSFPAYVWATVAGLCIGSAEVCYFYLYGGIGHSQLMPANVAVPTIVSGTIVITLFVSYFLLREALSIPQLIGAGLVIGGLILMFTGR
jgi:drug/metabolite transporter (DMT)-like permease